MALIVDYKSCLDNIVLTDRKIEAGTYTKGRLNTQFASELEKLNSYKSGIEERLSQEYKIQLDRILTSKTADLVKKQEGIANQLRQVPEGLAAKRQDILNEVAPSAYTADTKRIQALERFVGVESKRFVNIDHRLDANIAAQAKDYTLNLDQLEYLQYTLGERLKDYSPGDYVTPIEKVVGLLCWDSAFLKALHPFHQVCLYLAWLFVLIAVIFWVHALFILPYGLFYLYSLIRSSKKMNELLNLYYPFQILSAKVKSVKDDLTESLNAERQRKLAALESEERFKLNHLQKLYNAATQDVLMARQRLTAETSEEELTASVRESIANTLKSQEDFVKSLQTQVESNRQSLTAVERDKKLLLEEKERLKQQLTQTYLYPKTPGDAKIMPESFFLGFDNEGALMEFNHGCQSTLVEYLGSSSQCVTDLLMMMTIQLLMTMDITSISLSFIDTYSGGVDFAVFQDKELSSVFETIATDDLAVKLVESLHDTQRALSSKILIKADNIVEYNKMMLERKSFTQDYHILFFQTLPERVLKDTKFLQLCKNGPAVGIIPIIFMSQDFLKETSKERYESRILLASFIESINSRLFCYDSKTLNLEQRHPQYRDRLLEIYRRKDTK